MSKSTTEDYKAFDERISREALHKAWELLRPLATTDDNESKPEEEIVLVLEAIAAVHEYRLTAEKERIKSGTKIDEYSRYEDEEIVASALAAVDHDELIHDAAPFSLLGSRFILFAQAQRILEAHDYFLGQCEVPLGCATWEARKVAALVKAQHGKLKREESVE